MSAEEVDSLLLSLVKDQEEDASSSPISAPGSPLSSSTDIRSAMTDSESLCDSADGEALLDLLQEPQRQQFSVVTVAVEKGRSRCLPKRARQTAGSHVDEYPP